MSLDIPMIVTNFLDFELEERSVRILSEMGFRISERKISNQISLAVDEILVIDEVSSTSIDIASIPSIVVPQQASHWSDAHLFTYLQRHFIPDSNHGSSCDLLITGGDSTTSLRTELIAHLASISITALHARFEESDLRLALVPTRRSEEIQRLNRFAQAKVVLFLLSTETQEVQQARAFMEYRARIHSHLQLGFVVIGGRRSSRSLVADLLQPGPIFHLPGRDDGLLSFSLISKNGDRMQRFGQIVEWIGSCHDVARKPDHHIGAPRRRRDRAPLGVGGAMATTR